METPGCFPQWVSFPFVYNCRACSSDPVCADYDHREVCEADPCEVIAGENTCTWVRTGTIDGYCSKECHLYNDNEDECFASGCLPERDRNGNYIEECRECPRDMTCTKYRWGKDCLNDPCPTPGKCFWLERKCIVDSDGDEVPDPLDNCPHIFNEEQYNRYCSESKNCDFVPADEKAECCHNDGGDSCSDTDGDGLFDQDEVDLGTNPLQTDSNGNCIPDGVEMGFDPIIDILEKIAVGLGAAMIAYAGIRFVTADTPADRSSAKDSLIYIIFGLILLIGGSKMVVYIFQENCAGEGTTVGVTCECTGALPSCCDACSCMDDDTCNDCDECGWEDGSCKAS